jgi:hypothetical protein
VEFYFNGNPVTITAIPNPGFTFNHWQSNLAVPSGDTSQTLTLNFTGNDSLVAYFSGSPVAAHLTVSEINYHSDSASNAGDWFEIHNLSPANLDISQWKVRDGDDTHLYSFPLFTVIPASGFLVVSSDLEKFQTIHPDVSRVIGDIGFKLGDGGDMIRISDYKDSLYLSLDYDDELPWPQAADGDGYTLELLSDTGNLSDGDNWFADVWVVHQVPPINRR